VRLPPATRLLVICRSKGQAQAGLARLTALLADLGLEPKAAKTRIVQLAEGGEGFDFLGFHHRLVRSRVSTRQVVFLARWPSRKAAQHARDRIRDLTARSRLAVPVEQVVREVNTFIRGWVGYFRYGNSTRVFDKIRSPGSARAVPGQTAQAWPRLGLEPGGLPITGPARTDLPPRDRRRPQAQPALAGSSRTPPVKNVGEPCAGEPHARFDGRGLETGRFGVTAPAPDPTTTRSTFCSSYREAINSFWLCAEWRWHDDFAHFSWSYSQLVNRPTESGTTRAATHHAGNLRSARSSSGVSPG
jgi:hypothetical protein